MSERNMITTPGGEFVNFIPNTAVAVVKSDTTRFPKGLLYVGTAGDVVAICAGQTSTVTFKGMAAGTFLPVYIIAVYDATTAADMLICY